MGEPFIGSEAVANRAIAKSTLRTQYTKVLRDVYVSAGTELTHQVRARAAWLWSGRRGIIAGLSASALHGAEWVDAATPVEIFHSNRNPGAGLQIRGDRINTDEVDAIAGIPATTPTRTALDLACWYPVRQAVTAIDALARATDLKLPEVEALAARYPGRRGIRRARSSLALVDPGAQSPQETRLRLLLIGAGLPAPQTQIPVRDEFGNAIAFLDMGWEDVKVAVEYDGEHHRASRGQYTRDIRRLEMLERRGWIVVRVVAGDRPADILRRVRAALAHRASR